jgi:hypothetical protein
MSMEYDNPMNYSTPGINAQNKIYERPFFDSLLRTRNQVRKISSVRRSTVTGGYKKDYAALCGDGPQMPSTANAEMSGVPSGPINGTIKYTQPVKIKYHLLSSFRLATLLPL